ncbi:MAG: hypothetical protein KGV44_14860 [Flavobacteriaceae bacterium]|nr:hypothetical protein [Flavobacteriaceae bacterium]
MVRIIGFQERQKEDGTIFYVLELQGGIETVISQTTGNMYLTAKKATLPSTFDKVTCQALIGTDMEGQIVKEECEPYLYTVKETGEELTLHHRYVYKQKESEIPGTYSNMNNAFDNQESVRAFA